MKKSILLILSGILMIITLIIFTSAQIYNEDFSKAQKTNIYKSNKVWMAYGWTFYYPKGVQEKKGKKTSFERFDREGNRTEEIYYDTKGNPNFSCQFLYDESGNTIKKMGGSGDEVIYEKWNYTALEGGKTIERKSEYKKSKNEKWIYTFDSRNNIVSESYYDINGTISYKWDFFYDDKQQVTEKKEYDSYGNVYQKWVYKYDEKGNNIEMRHYVSNNLLHRIYDMKYDKKGNMKSKFTFDKDENIVNLTVFVYQFYDGLHSARSVGNKK
ncbi:MAG: hypothetical protein EPN85_03775 [Bacteroidetes bacterium]|nr:MAG: hypothetical protein EPN85_03775 [Bacteroidota bacterium]